MPSASAAEVVMSPRCRAAIDASTRSILCMCRSQLRGCDSQRTWSSSRLYLTATRQSWWGSGHRGVDELVEDHDGLLTRFDDAAALVGTVAEPALHHLAQVDVLLDQVLVEVGEKR